MRSVLFIILIGTFVSLNTSCKRCYQCVVVNGDGDLQWGYNKICERPNALEDYENICEQAVLDRIKELSLEGDEADLNCKCGENLEL